MTKTPTPASTTGRARRTPLVIASAIALATLGASAYLAISPRLMLLNDGIRLAYPALGGVALAACALGLAVLAALRTPVLARVAMAVAAAILLLGSVQRLTYRIEADSQGLRLRTPPTHAALPWREIARAHATADALFLVANDGRRIEISLGELRPQQRVAVTRTISRRVSEASGIR